MQRHLPFSRVFIDRICMLLRCREPHPVRFTPTSTPAHQSRIPLDGKLKVWKST